MQFERVHRSNSLRRIVRSLVVHRSAPTQDGTRGWAHHIIGDVDCNETRDASSTVFGFEKNSKTPIIADRQVGTLFRRAIPLLGLGPNRWRRDLRTRGARRVPAKCKRSRRTGDDENQATSASREDSLPATRRHRNSSTLISEDLAEGD